jgi:hypothetical protein
VDTEVVTFEIKVADVAADLNRVGLGTRQFVASSLLTRADNQNNQSLLTGTVTTQSPLVGTGTFQSNSPVGVGSVHDIHASNIDINAQARTEMSSNPFVWMFNMPNQQDFWKVL